MRLVQNVDEHEIGSLRIASGDVTTEIYPKTEPGRRLPRLYERAFGSIDGVLVAVSFAAANPSFTVRERLDGVQVTCHFDSNRFYQEVIENLRRRVVVSGTVNRRPNGVPTDVTNVDRIDPIPREEDCPNRMTFLGSIPISLKD